MSTRSCIARVTGEGTFKGVYHHWDGYPTALGATLFKLYRGHFKRDLNAMLIYLIDLHPAGWSTINEGDFTQAPGFREKGFNSPGPQCYCHGGRHEEANEITEETDAGMEWAYVFDTDKKLMFVLERLFTDDAGPGEKIFTGEKVPNLAGHHMTGMFGMGAEGHQRWAIAAEVDLNGDTPNWDKITAENYQNGVEYVKQSSTRVA